MASLKLWLVCELQVRRTAGGCRGDTGSALLRVSCLQRTPGAPRLCRCLGHGANSKQQPMLHLSEVKGLSSEMLQK